MGERREKNYALVKEREFNLIFSLSRRTLVGSEKLIHAPSPPLVREKKKKKKKQRESSLRARTWANERNQANVFPEKTRWLECQ